MTIVTLFAFFFVMIMAVLFLITSHEIGDAAKRTGFYENFFPKGDPTNAIVAATILIIVVSSLMIMVIVGSAIVGA